MKALTACLALALTAVLTVGQVASASQSEVAHTSRTKTVDIRNFAFHPGTLGIGKGTKVVFSNSSGVTHTATDKGVFDTGRIKAGRSVAVRFGQKGTFAYHCKIHSFMHGKIVVD